MRNSGPFFIARFRTCNAATEFSSGVIKKAALLVGRVWPVSCLLIVALRHEKSLPAPMSLSCFLLAMGRLTPKDFHAVRSRMLVDGEKGASGRELLQGVRGEQDLQLDGDQRGMGFLRQATRAQIWRPAQAVRDSLKTCSGTDGASTHP